MSDTVTRTVCNKRLGAEHCKATLRPSDMTGLWECDEGHLWYGRSHNVLSSKPWKVSAVIKAGDHESLDLALFDRDDGPEDIPRTARIVHIVYLHQNGSLIIKHPGYEFSENCYVSEGGLVQQIWWPDTQIGNLEKDLHDKWLIDQRDIDQLKDRLFNV